jgi:hypothetical protein
MPRAFSYTIEGTVATKMFPNFKPGRTGLYLVFVRYYNCPLDALGQQEKRSGYEVQTEISPWRKSLIQWTRNDISKYFRGGHISLGECSTILRPPQSTSGEPCSEHGEDRRSLAQAKQNAKTMVCRG